MKIRYDRRESVLRSIADPPGIVAIGQDPDTERALFYVDPSWEPKSKVAPGESHIDARQADPERLAEVDWIEPAEMVEALDDQVAGAALQQYVLAAAKTVVEIGLFRGEFRAIRQGLDLAEETCFLIAERFGPRAEAA